MINLTCSIPLAISARPHGKHLHNDSTHESGDSTWVDPCMVHVFSILFYVENLLALFRVLTYFIVSSSITSKLEVQFQHFEYLLL
jgi:hypothetical protein